MDQVEALNTIQPSSHHQTVCKYEPPHSISEKKHEIMLNIITKDLKKMLMQILAITFLIQYEFDNKVLTEIQATSGKDMHQYLHIKNDKVHNTTW